MSRMKLTDFFEAMDAYNAMSEESRNAMRDVASKIAKLDSFDESVIMEMDMFVAEPAYFYGIDCDDLGNAIAELYETKSKQASA